MKLLPVVLVLAITSLVAISVNQFSTQLKDISNQDSWQWQDDQREFFVPEMPPAENPPRPENQDRVQQPAPMPPEEVRPPRAEDQP